MNNELNKKLAEWAGLNPEGMVAQSLTRSLDACFKWLVPKTLEMLTEKGYVPPIMKLFQLWYDELVSLTGDSSNVQQVALALCLAIEKLIDEVRR